MRRFEEINCKFGLRPLVEGYQVCTDTRLRFERTYTDIEKNQDIDVICKISRWDITSADKEEFDKQFEMISFPEDEKEGAE